MWARAPDALDLPGIDLDEARLWDVLERAAAAGRATGQLETPRYGGTGGMFNHGDEATYRGVIALSRPARILEIGIGDSTAIALDTIACAGLDTQVDAIDPDPVRIGDWATADIAEGRLEVRPGLAQDLTPDEVAELDAGDILFVDSSHVGKAGSDVLYELFRLFPAIRPGVWLHVHDIPAPFEYPADWLGSERRFWNEAYLLRAFLMFNSAFRVETWPSYLAARDPERLHLLLDGPPGGSIWLRRT